LAFPLIGFSADRDITIARNIAHTFDDHPEEDNQIDIMGAAHMPGVAHYLETEYGFTKISL